MSQNRCLEFVCSLSGNRLARGGALGINEGLPGIKVRRMRTLRRVFAVAWRGLAGLGEPFFGKAQNAFHLKYNINIQNNTQTNQNTITQEQTNKKLYSAAMGAGAAVQRNKLGPGHAA